MLDYDPTVTTSLNQNYLFKSPISKQSPIGWRDFNTWIGLWVGVQKFSFCALGEVKETQRNLGLISSLTVFLENIAKKMWGACYLIPECRSGGGFRGVLFWGKRELTKIQRKLKSLSCVWHFVTPWTIQSMEFSRPEYWSGQLFPSPGASSQPRDRTRISCIIGRFLTSWVTREAQEYWEPILSPVDLPNPGIEPRSPALQEDSLPAELPGNPLRVNQGLL